MSRKDQLGRREGMEKRVLVVDDEGSLRRTVAFGLMQRGYETELCESGMKGLETIQAYKKKNLPLDCAIVDIRLPDINGLNLLKAIKRNYPSLPVVIISGHGNERIAEEAKKADGYLEKPFDMDDLVRVVEETRKAKTRQAAACEPEAGHSCTAYVLVTLRAGADLGEVHEKLYAAENMVYCDTVRGEELMLLAQAESPEKLDAFVNEKVRSIPGVIDVVALTVEAPVLAHNVDDVVSAVDKALGKDKAYLRDRFIASLLDFLDLLATR
jgi:FixJ family two-component response regulator